MYAGVRYLSRLNTAWECWAVFSDVSLTEVERRPVLLDMDELQQVAKLYDLRLH